MKDYYQLYVKGDTSVCQWYKCHSCKSICCHVIIGGPDHPKNPSFETDCITFRYKHAKCIQFNENHASKTLFT